MRTRFVVVVAALVGLLSQGTPAVAITVADTTAVRETAAVVPRAGGPAVSLGGGDVLPLASPALAFSGGAGAPGSWRTVGLPAAVPKGAASAVFVSVQTKGASRAGQILVRGAQTQGSAQAVDYRKTGSAVGTALIRIGNDGVQISATAGRPKVQLRILGWVPRTSALVVPGTPVPSGSVKLVANRPQSVKVARAGVPVAATRVLLQIRTTKARAGRLALWSGPDAVPTSGTAFPTGNHVALLAAAPVNGKVSLRALSGRAKATIHVVAWAGDGVSLTTPGRQVALPIVKPGGARTVRVAGRGPIPGQDVRMAVLTVSAPRGAKVSLGSHPAVDTRGGAVTFPASLDKQGKVTVRVTGGRATLSVTGWSVDAAGEEVSFVPAVGTVLLGPADVVATSGSSITVDRAAPGVPLGGHVWVRPRSGAASYLGEVLASESRSGGSTLLRLGPATLAAAFTDFDVSYTAHDGLPQPPERAGIPAARAGQPAQRGGVTRRMPLGLDDWSCSSATSGGGVTTDIDVSLLPNLYVDLSNRILDFSAKGTVTATASVTKAFQGECTLDPDKPMVSVPVGTTGLALKMGVQGNASIDAEGTLTLTNTSRAYASFSYYDGQTDSAASVGNGSTLTPDGQVSLGLDLGVNISIGPLQPPGTEDVITAAVSLTIGVGFDAVRPMSEHAEGELRGPACFDLTATPSLEVGAQLVVPFLPDVNVSLPPVELPTVTLFRGPCIGYTGSINLVTEYVHNDDRHSRTVNINLVGEPMVFGGDLMQPFTWKASSHGFYKVLVSDPPPGYCTFTYDAEGDGFVGWSDERWPHLNLSDWKSPGTQYIFLNGTWPGPDITGTQTGVCPGVDAETDPWRDNAWPAGTSIAAPPAGYPGGLHRHASFSLTGEYYPDDFSTVTYTFNLTRQSFNR